MSASDCFAIRFLRKSIFQVNDRYGVLTARYMSLKNVFYGKKHGLRDCKHVIRERERMKESGWRWKDQKTKFEAAKLETIRKDLPCRVLMPTICQGPCPSRMRSTILTGKGKIRFGCNIFIGHRYIINLIRDTSPAFEIHNMSRPEFVTIRVAPEF